MQFLRFKEATGATLYNCYPAADERGRTTDRCRELDPGTGTNEVTDSAELRDVKSGCRHLPSSRRLRCRSGEARHFLSEQHCKIYQIITLLFQENMYSAVKSLASICAIFVFVGNAVYQEVGEGRENIAQFEFIPWILAQCASVEEAREKLDKMNLVGTQFGEQLPAAQLHWIIADEKECIVVECMVDGLHVYDNPVGVLTNNPPFPQQMFLLNQYMHLSPKQPVNTFCEQLPFGAVQPRYGSVGTAGRSFFHIAFCPRGVYQTACYVRRVRDGKCQSVFPHFRFG